MLWSLIGSIRGKVLDIVDDVVEDKEAANRLKLEIQRALATPSPKWALLAALQSLKRRWRS